MIQRGNDDYDAILSDVRMPDLSGVELHRWVADRWPALARRMIFIFGGLLPDDQDYLAGLANPCLIKPVACGDLLDQVSVTCASADPAWPLMGMPIRV